MNCNNCGYENVDGANYCTSCNYALYAAAADAAAEAPENATATDAADTTDATEAAATADTSAAEATATDATAAYYTAQTTDQTQQASAAYYNTAQSRTATPYSYQQSYYYPYATPKAKQPFTITDAYIIIGFVLAIVGIFTYAFILLPASIFFSVVGFVKRTNARTLGLSIAGIVVGVVACLIKIGMVLNELGVIPDWLSAGIF